MKRRAARGAAGSADRRRQRAAGRAKGPGAEALLAAAQTALTACMGISRDERLLVVCDPPCVDVGEAFLRAGAHLARETVMVQITPRGLDGEEPPEPVGAWLGQFDVAVMPTSMSLTHTKARRDACAAGTRVATLPGITSEIFVRTMRTDWRALAERTRVFAARLNSATTVRITTAAGADLTFETGGRKARSDDGDYRKRGVFGNLPAGEAYLAPLEGTARGRLVADGSFPLAGLLRTPLVVEVRDGLAQAVSGNPCSRELRKVFDRIGPDARNVAEFGVGTLDTARISGNVLEDEKALGTIHIALGNNASMGGRVTAPVHLDAVVRKPSVWLDGALWMRDGVVG
jgi:leucyl aminopeptidase (aminopeptidase T)